MNQKEKDCAEEIKRRIEVILRAANCQLVNGCKGPKAAVDSRLEFWAVPTKGLLILQIWANGGIDIFPNWLIGWSDEDLEKALDPKNNELREDCKRKTKGMKS